jgi:hypothetical protein
VGGRRIALTFEEFKLLRGRATATTTGEDGHRRRRVGGPTARGTGPDVAAPAASARDLLVPEILITDLQRRVLEGFLETRRLATTGGSATDVDGERRRAADNDDDDGDGDETGSITNEGVGNKEVVEGCRDEMGGDTDGRGVAPRFACGEEGGGGADDDDVDNAAQERDDDDSIQNNRSSFDLERSLPERDGPIPAAAILDEENILPSVIAADSIAESEETPSSPPDTMMYGGGIPDVLFIHDDWEERAGFVTTPSHRSPSV